MATTFQVQRVLHVTSFEEERRHNRRLDYRLSRSPEERVATVEFLRR